MDGARGRRRRAPLVVLALLTRVPTFCALLSAALAGAAGMAFQVLALSSAGLLLGYGRSTALGLSAFLAAWALGAGVAGRETARMRRSFVAAGALSCVLQPLAIAGLHADRASLHGAGLAGVVALACIAFPAFVQGLFLPWLARSGARVDRLVVANLAGALVGAFVVAEAATAAFGRLPAACVAGALALCAGLSGARAFAARAATPFSAVHEPRDSTPRAESRSGTSQRAIVAVVALCTSALVAHEWIALRLGVLWLGGMQPSLVAVTCAALCALFLGAALVPRVVPRDGRGIAWVIALAAATTAWPFAAPHVLRWIARSTGAEGADLGALEQVPAFVRALVLVGPPLVPLGAFVPVLHRASDGESGARLARIFWPEAIGAAVAIPLVHELVVPRFGLSGALVACAAVLAGAAVVTLRASKPAFAWTCLATVGVVMLARQAPAPALAAPPLANPALRVLSFDEDREFAVAVVDDGLLGERTLLTDGFRAAGTGRDYRYMQALGHLPVLLHEAPRRVAVLALGTGTTVGAVALHGEVERIDVLEISRAVVEAAPFFEAKNHGALREGLPGLEHTGDGAERVVVRLGDGRATLAESPGAFDVVTMEPLLPDSPFAVYLYTSEFYAIARRALREGGLVCQWVPPHALEPRTFEAVVRAFADSFAWSSCWLFGTQLVLVGARTEPELDARRFSAGSPALADELANVGLASVRDALARFVCIPRFDPSERTRALRDGDPWTVHLPRRRGAQLLTDLPLNLAWLARFDRTPPAAWNAIDGAASAFDGGAALRVARTAHARDEARLRGAQIARVLDVLANDAVFGLAPALARARELLGADRELDDLASEIAFLDDLRSGVALLHAGDARAALQPLRRAVLARPERADVHLYAAVVLERVGDPNATRALQRALESCPGIFETAPGRTALRLGLGAESIASARAALRAR